MAPTRQGSRQCIFNETKRFLFTSITGWSWYRYVDVGWVHTRLQAWNENEEGRIIGISTDHRDLPVNSFIYKNIHTHSMHEHSQHTKNVSDSARMLKQPRISMRNTMTFSLSAHLLLQLLLHTTKTLSVVWKGGKERYFFSGHYDLIVSIPVRAVYNSSAYFSHLISQNGKFMAITFPVFSFWLSQGFPNLQ